MSTPGVPVDLVAVIEAQQQQIDDLTEAVQAQQRTLALLHERLDAGPASRTGRP